jgi:transcriptional regulator with XRE-family HTH domain
VDVWLIDTSSPRVQCSLMAGVGAAEQVYKAFGAQVRKRREVLGLTQLQLSTHIGLTRGSVANIEAGRQSVLLHQFLAIAAALQQTPEQLLPTQTETPPTREQPEMPESVLNALKMIKKSAGTHAPSRR